MNKKLIDWWGAGGASNDSFYQAVLDRATTLAYTKPTSQQTAQNTLSGALNTGGIYSLMDAIHMFAVNNSGVENFSTLNWKTPTTIQAVPNGSPAYGVAGYNSGSGTAYVSSGFNGSSSGINWVDNSSVSISMWVPQWHANFADMFCTSGAEPNRNFAAKFDATQILTGIHFTGEPYVSFATLTAYDFITFSVYGGTFYAFQNGVQRTSAARTLSTSPNAIIRYMGQQQVAHPTSMILGAAFIGAGITLAQHTTIYNALAAYKTAIGL